MNNRFKTWSKIFNAIVLMIGFGVLLGWMFNIEFLKRSLPNSVAMNPATAVAFIFSGIAFILLTSKNTSYKKLAGGNLLAAIVLFIGCIKFAGIIFGFDAKIDHILFSGQLDNELAGHFLNRMAPNTAFCFMFIGTALLLLHFKTSKKVTPANFFTLIIWLGGFISILGYIYHVKALYHIFKYIPMAFHTALGVLCMSLAIFLAYPDRGIMKEFNSPFAGSATARKFLLPAIVFPITLGLFQIYFTDKGLIPVEMGTELVILSIVIVFLVYIYNNAVSLNKKDMERKKIEEILVENQQITQSFMDNASSLIYLKDLDGKYIMANNSYKKMFGINEKEMKGKTVFDLLNYESALQVQQQEEELVRENKIFEGEQQMPIAGNLHHFYSVSFPLTNASGKVYAIGGISTNITEIKKQSDLIKDLYDNAPSGYYSLNGEGKFINANNTTFEWLGYTKEELIGKSLNDLLTDKGKEFFKKLFPIFKKKGYIKDIEFIYKRKDGSEIYVLLNATAVNNEHGEFLHTRSTMVDITKRKKLEMALEESNDKFLRLFYSSPLAMVIRNLDDGKILDVNEEYERLLGYKKEDLAGKTSAEIGMILDPEFGKQLRSTASQIKSLKNIEATLYNSKKEPINVIVSIEKISLENKDYILSALIDITERKKTEQELQTVNKELESFTYSVSHDLRAPLRIINGYAQMIKEEGSKNLTEEPRRMLENIITNAKQMGNLIDDLLNFSRLGRRELITHNTDMNAIVQPIVEQQLNNGHKNYDIKVHDLPPSYCDSGLIKQVLENLISNAVKYSANNPNPFIEIGSLKENDKTVYYIKDNGAGFDMKYYDKLFGVFQRLHKASEFEGTGVGLALTQRIILKHGGKIWAESKVNEGATFYFTVCKS